MVTRPEPAPRFAHFVLWQLVAELVRRHGAPDRALHVLEGAAADRREGLAIHATTGPDAPAGAPLAWFEGFRTLTLPGRPAVAPDAVARDTAVQDAAALDVVAAWLEAHDPGPVVERVERALGLPTPPTPWPGTTVPALVHRVMAAMLAHGLTTRLAWQWRALVDATPAGPRPRPALLAHPSLVEPSEAPAPAPGRIWMLVEDPGDPEPAAVVDLAGVARYGPGLEARLDLVAAWRRQPSVARLAARLWDGDDR